MTVASIIERKLLYDRKETTKYRVHLIVRYLMWVSDLVIGVIYEPVVLMYGIDWVKPLTVYKTMHKDFDSHLTDVLN